MLADARRPLTFLLGAALPIPFAIEVGALQGDRVALGLIGWLVVLIGLALVGALRGKRLMPPGRLTQLLLIFIAFSAASVILGMLRYHALGGVLSYAYQVVLLLNVPLGYRLLGDATQLVWFWCGYTVTTAAESVAVTTYVVPNLACVGLVRTHNSLALRQSLYGWPNYYGILLVAALLITMALLGRSRRSAWRGIFAVMVLVLLVGLVVTFSRTAYLVVLLALAMLVLRLRRQIPVGGVVAAAASLAVASLLVVPQFGLTQRLCSAEALREGQGFEALLNGATLVERVKFDAIVLRSIDPVTILLGSGYQNTNVVLARQRDQIVTGRLTVGMMTTHDEFLTILLKTGMVGLGLLGTVFVLILLRVYRLSVGTGPVEQLFVHWWAFLVPVFVSFLVGETLRYFPVAALFWLMAGAALNFRPAPAAREPGAS